MEEWFYVIDGIQYGPATFETLQQLAAQGTIKRQTMVWRQGLATWAPASSVPGLFTTPPPLNTAYTVQPPTVPPPHAPEKKAFPAWGMFGASGAVYCLILKPLFSPDAYGPGYKIMGGLGLALFFIALAVANEKPKAE